MFDCLVNASGRALLNPLHSVRAINDKGETLCKKRSARKVALFRFIPPMKSVGHAPNVCVCVCKDMGSVIILVFAF